MKMIKTLLPLGANVSVFTLAVGNSVAVLEQAHCL